MNEYGKIDCYEREGFACDEGHPMGYGPRCERDLCDEAYREPCCAGLTDDDDDEVFDDPLYDECCCDEPRSHNKSLGERGEEAAARYLEHYGFEIIERNWCCPMGEADIIAIDGDELVFVEVKTRTSEARGLPEDAVTRDKRRRYERIALDYLRHSSFSNITVRFDVIGITLISHDRAFLRHHRNAFGRGE